MKLGKLIAAVVLVFVFKVVLAIGSLLTILYFAGPFGLKVLGAVFVICESLIWVGAFAGWEGCERIVVRELNQGPFVYIRDGMLAGFLAYYGFMFLSGAVILGLALLMVAGKIIEENHHAKLYAKRRG